MKQEISKQSFDQIKLIDKALRNEYYLDKKQGDVPDQDFLFDRSDLMDSTNRIIDKNSHAHSLFDLMKNNHDYSTALNLKFVDNEQGTFVFHKQDSVNVDNCLLIPFVLSDTNQLLKLGRKGIQQKINYNCQLIKNLNNKLDNPCIE